MSQAMPPPANGVNNAVSTDPEKKTEESGGIFGGIFDSKPDESAAATASVTANQAEGSNVGVENEKEKEKESGGLFSGLLGSNNEGDKPKTAENGADGLAKEEEKPGFFANLLKGDEAPVQKEENAPEAAAEAAAATGLVASNSSTEEKKADVPLLDRVKGIFSSPSDEKKNGILDNTSEDEESDESDESDESEEGDDEVELFLTKIKTLRSKCRKMKTKYRTLKDKYVEIKTKGPTNGDNSDFTKIVASILAMEGVVKQNKLYIKEYAKKNNIPIDGFSLNDEEEREERSEDEEEMAKLDETSDEENKEQPLPLPLSGSESESESESGSESGSGSESEEESEGGPLEPVSVNSNESLPISMGAEGKEPEFAPLETALPASSPSVQGPAPTVPPISTGAPAPIPGQISSEISKILGGRSHFIKKNHIKTHRHHNRRNRHKTLKNKV